MEGFKYNSGDPLRGIVPRSMEEIFRLASNEIRKSEFRGDFTFGIVLTGGSSNVFANGG